MLAIAATTVGVSRVVTENRAPAGSAAGVDDLVAVVGRVRPHDDQPRRAGPAADGQRIREQLGRATGGVCRTLAQPGGRDQWRRDRGGDHREQRVKPFHAGVAATGALPGIPVGAAHGVVDVDHHQLVGVGQDRGGGREAGQQTRGDGVELADMPEGERPQERPQRRRRPHTGEQPAHPTMAQQVHIGDRVRTADHPATSARTFAAAFAPPFAAIVSRSASSAARPHQATSAITGTSPAQDTRFGSSNRTPIARRA
jgi:hypothetical protein